MNVCCASAGSKPRRMQTKSNVCFPLHWAGQSILSFFTFLVHFLASDSTNYYKLMSSVQLPHCHDYSRSTAGLKCNDCRRSALGSLLETPQNSKDKSETSGDLAPGRIT